MDQGVTLRRRQVRLLDLVQPLVLGLSRLCQVPRAQTRPRALLVDVRTEQLADHSLRARRLAKESIFEVPRLAKQVQIRQRRSMDDLLWQRQTPRMSRLDVTKCTRADE
jgi:hypothetical protein